MAYHSDASGSGSLLLESHLNLSASERLDAALKAQRQFLKRWKDYHGNRGKTTMRVRIFISRRTFNSRRAFRWRRAFVLIRQRNGQRACYPTRPVSSGRIVQVLVVLRKSLGICACVLITVLPSSLGHQVFTTRLPAGRSPPESERVSCAGPMRSRSTSRMSKRSIGRHSCA